ncbi:hypothetical protein D4764_09G0000060 [Takifugu flavidus]|uniref:Ig-like domain-containing protein n=1 Tax=Takifugu flavidus TaxID=433684 RepID=A0A5C6MNI0_9TELE|nr:hypothetical protein D4764_09G0000060 [Takifugu flavidus]
MLHFRSFSGDLLSGSTETKHCRGMKAVMGLLLMLVRVSLGVETSCDGRQDKTQCYGALGGTLVLQLMDKVPEILTFKWRKSNVTILNRIGNGPVTIDARLSNRSEFISHNGTLRMNSLSRTDGGEYTLEIFNEDGVRTAVRTQQLNIQAPVSTVRLTSECLSQGEKRMSCSSDGDSPQYSWTLDGDTLTDDQLLSGNNETNEIILKQTVSGRLVCLVRNHISEASVTEMISTCGRSTLMVIGIVLSLLLIGLMAAFVMVCAHKRRESSNARGGNDQELQYADVKRQQPSRDVQPQAEMGGYGQITFSAQTDKPPVGRGAVQRGQEVEYGEIKFAERPQQKNRLMGPSGSPQGAPQVEYGEIKFIERPRRAR